MMLIHPVIMIIAILACTYVYILGLQRFRFLHLHQKVAFKWKRHVTLGSVVFIVMLMGLIGGFAMVFKLWGGIMLTGAHGRVALVMIPFILFSGISGLYMNAKNKKRTALPMAHGISNSVIILMSISQILTGWAIIKPFLS